MAQQAKPLDPRWYEKPVALVLLTAALAVLGPVLAGIVLLFLTPRSLKPVKPVSCNVVSSERYSAEYGEPGREIEINGQSYTAFTVHRVKVRNPGDETVDSLVVELVFESARPDPRILAMAHASGQKFGSSQIKESHSGKLDGRVEYEWINQGGEDMILVLTNTDGHLAVMLKGKGVEPVLTVASKKKGLYFAALSVVGPVVIIFLIGFAVGKLAKR